MRPIFQNSDADAAIASEGELEMLLVGYLLLKYDIYHKLILNVTFSRAPMSHRILRAIYGYIGLKSTSTSTTVWFSLRLQAFVC